jgi:hypothetical protein
MAEIVTIPSNTLFKGTDHEFPVTVLNSAQTAAIDITSFALSFVMKRTKSGSAVVTKTTPSGISIGGTYDADPDVNTQVATVIIADTDTDDLPTGNYYYEVKRTDAGLESIIVQGTVPLERALHTS